MTTIDEAITALPEKHHEWARQAFFDSRVRALRLIRVEEGTAALEDALESVALTEGRETRDALVAALAERHTA